MAAKGKITMYFKKKVGKDYVSFSAEGENLHEAVMASKKLSFEDIETCGICGSNNLELSAHVTPDEGHEYTYVRCKACRATLNFGQQKKDDTIFYFRTVEKDGQKFYDWKAFNPPQQHQ